LHNLNSGKSPLFIRAISHSNEYDFTQKHRHSYFEIIFFEKGGGKQLIDFQEYEVMDYTCYLIYPNQIHLLDRAPGSFGKLIQFRAESVMSLSLLSKLRERIWGGSGGVVFQKSQKAFSKMMDILNQFEADSETERNLHLLQVLLFDLLAQSAKQEKISSTDAIFNRFLQLVDTHFSEQNSVQFYLSSLPISEKKLALLSKHHLGMSSLQVIHHRIVLEAKRLLLFGQQPLKEISYSLGFDSPASFSAFIKKKTGNTPSGLQLQLEEIHK